MKLDIERMSGFGEYNVDGHQVNYLYGLNELCEENITKESIVLELGCNDGVSTSLFSKYAKKVFAVDMNKTSKMNNLLEEIDNIYFYKMSFSQFFFQNIEKFDFIYIDGNHEYQEVREDIINSLNFVKDGGLIGGHDYNSSCPGVVKAVKEFFGDNIKIYSDSSWVNKK